MNAESFLRERIRVGDLAVSLPGGRRLTFGDGSGPKVALAIADHATIARILARPSLGLGEGYMAGRVRMETGGIRDLVDLAARNAGDRRPFGRPGPLAQWWARTAIERNARRAARRNVAHHYDLSLDLYRRFLDPDLQYSCAYFTSPACGLEEAQLAKKKHIAAKLLLTPGARVLDIGCGWGGLALALASWTGAELHGITLSTEQVQTAVARAGEAGLSQRARFSLTDYRDAEGPYDRIVSVGMFEHVGRPNYQRFFDKVASLMTRDGVALIHAIGRAEPPSATDPFTLKYIFPGGYIPSLSEVLPAVERAGLRVADLEILRFHYAETLRCWSENFQAHRAAVVEAYDERFCRMWEYYLAMAEMGFRYRGLMAFQLQLTKRFDAVPMTRDYIAAAERRMDGDATPSPSARAEEVT